MLKQLYYSLAFLLAILSGISTVNAQCNPNCVQSTNLNFSTGWDETTGALINIGQIDPHWRTMNLPPLTAPAPASVNPPAVYAITPLNATWNVITGSRAMSMANMAGFGPNNANATQPWRFRRYFCVCQDSEVVLTGRIKADDTGTLTLYRSNGTPTAFSVALLPAPNTDNFNVGVPFSQAIFLPQGNYYFEFDLLNTNAVASGFAVQGQMTSANGLTLYDEQLGCCAVSVITGQKIIDENCDAMFDPGADYPGAGFVFDLIDNSTGNVIATTQSNALGEFEFNNLTPGNYTVRERTTWGWVSSPISTQVTLGPLDVQTVLFFNCAYTPTVWAGCTYGDIIANPANIHDERGLAITTDGGFFGSNSTYTFTATDIPSPNNPNEQLVSKSWDNATGSLQAGAKLNFFTDQDAGTHFIDNMFVLNRPSFCTPASRFATVGTLRNLNGNSDVFYAEFDANRTMLNYADATSTPGLEREVVRDFVLLSNNVPMWVGTKTTAPPSSTRVLLSRFDACSSVTSFSHREFSFQIGGSTQSVSGQSVVELVAPLPGYPNAKFAVTGKIGNEVYLLLLDANLNPVGPALKYDVDSNSGTVEEGIRIRRSGDNLFIVGNSRSSSQIPSNYQVFFLKLTFFGAQGLPQATTKLYDIPGLGEEVIDMELNRYNELILTGVCDFSALVFGATPYTEQTFLMGIDEFGNLLWTKKMDLEQGSRPTDIKFSLLFDEINVSGSCWTNELTGNPVQTYVRRYNEMIIRANRFGELTYNTTCSENITPVVTSPVPSPQDFSVSPVVPGFNFIAGNRSAVDYFTEIENCTIGSTQNVICDSLALTPVAIPGALGNCCFSIQYANNSPAPVYSLCILMGNSVPGTFTNVSAVSGLSATVSANGREIVITSSTNASLPLGSIINAIDFCLPAGVNLATINYLWKDVAGTVVCENSALLECPSCTADFTFTANCCDAAFTAQPNGAGPYLYAWDVNCDNPAAPDGTGPTLNWSFPAPGTYSVCLTVTDATGCSASVTKQITLTDNPPVITCPPSIVISTDPGACVATYVPVPPTATDDCTTAFLFGCDMTGATTGPLTNPVQLNKGITTVTCRTEDSKGQPASCTYDITVEDTEPPVITCPPPVSTSAAACAGGSVVFFNPPVFSDNCPMAAYVCSHQSGDFFPCGTTMVSCTATDMAGNQAACSFPVTVNCQCAEVSAGSISCTDVDDQFAFSINVIDNTNSGANGCTVSVSSNQPGVTLSGVVVTGGGPVYTVTGIINVAAPPMPNIINILVNVSCTCLADGTVHDCSFIRPLTTPCCKEISVDPQEVCRNSGTVQIPLIGCSSLYDVQQVRWYIADAPCPPASWGAPFQVTNGCSPLTLSPQYHNADVCVYAEVDMGPDAGPCRMLVTNPVTITLCEPASCSMSADQQYCYFGSSITPSPLSITVNTPCAYTVQWYDHNGNLIPGATGLTYQPPALSFTGAPDDCYQDFTYTAVITGGVCPDQSCSAAIRLYNDAAPLGSLVLLPPDTNPLCYGEDAILEYVPECAGEPERWNWFIRPDIIPAYAPLIANGDRNPLYYTNRLYEDTWVKVEKTNGVCPTDEIEIFLDIIDPIVIQTFTAEYDDPCNPATVNMTVDYKPQAAPAGCNYTVTWYRNGQVIGSTTTTATPVNFTYTPPAGAPIHGNYYCVVDSDCCPGAARSAVVTLEPPMEAYIAGPCFRCNCDTILLEGIVLYPVAGFNCTYQWYDAGIPIPGETNANLIVDPTWVGRFTFEVTCTDGITTCIKSDDYILLQCGNNDACTPPFCEGNLVQNGDFEQGNATAADEDIANASNWGGIWSNAGIGFSSADLYSNTTGVPFPLQAPLPTSQGQFAGFWSRIQGGNAFREGVLNELGATIMPNTGVYELNFKLACLFAPPAPASLSIFVANGNINGGAPITSGTSPLNNTLFANSWEIVTHPVLTSCDNNFQTYTYTIDTANPAFPTTGVNAIFFTRTDGVMPGAYVALDDVCLRRTCCLDSMALCNAVENDIFVSQTGDGMTDTATLHFSGFNSCSWLFVDWGDGTQNIVRTDSVSSLTHIYGYSGNFAITVTLEQYAIDGSPCLVCDWQNITRNHERSLASNLQIYPNPTDEQVRIDWGEASLFSRYILRSATGVNLYSAIVGAAETSASLDLTNLPDGLYFIHLYTNDGRQVVRKIVKH